MPKAKQKTIVLKVSDKVKEEMINHYVFMRRDKTPPYAIFQAQDADTVITLYESGKAMFQGISADIDANIWKQREAFLNPDLVEKPKRTLLLRKVKYLKQLYLQKLHQN